MRVCASTNILFSLMKYTTVEQERETEAQHHSVLAVSVRMMMPLRTNTFFVHLFRSPALLCHSIYGME